MNQRSQDYGNSRATGLTFCAPLPAGRRPRERQYVLQCEDARRAVTVQQTACATNFAQEEEKV